MWGAAAGPVRESHRATETQGAERVRKRQPHVLLVDPLVRNRLEAEPQSTSTQRGPAAAAVRQAPRRSNYRGQPKRDKDAGREFKYDMRR